MDEERGKVLIEEGAVEDALQDELGRAEGRGGEDIPA